jgi:hypothetical protein
VSPEATNVRGADRGFEVVASLEHAPGNIAVARDGRVWVTLHPFYSPPAPLAQVRSGSAVLPTRDELEAWGLHSPLGVLATDAVYLWVLDNARSAPAPPRLVGLDPQLVVARDIALGPVTPGDSFVNDLAYDGASGHIYIADPAGGANAALIVIGPDGPRRVLEGHESVVPEEVDLVIDGRPVELTRDGQTVRPHVGVNPIALGPAGEWLYYGPMHGTRMYRVPTSALRDPEVSADELASRVERFADKPICDGITIDQAGNLYLGDLARNAIGVIDASGRYRELLRHPQLSWVDAFSVGPDGMVYAAVNQLHRAPPFRGGEDESEPPYLIVRFPPADDGRAPR